jgi:hypothetical protein
VASQHKRAPSWKILAKTSPPNRKYGKNRDQQKSGLLTVIGNIFTLFNSKLLLQESSKFFDSSAQYVSLENPFPAVSPDLQELF